MSLLKYEDIQTPKDVWEKLLQLNPVAKDEIFYEPFVGEHTLYNQIDCKTKYWTEITKGKDVFDFDKDKKDEITCIYSNPPFKSWIYNKKKEKVYKNSVYYFLDYFITNYPNLNTIGFLINAKSFNALTPFRLSNLSKKGFNISAITILNTAYWFQTYYFVVFQKKEDKRANIYIIEKTFTTKFVSSL